MNVITYDNGAPMIPLIANDSCDYEKFKIQFYEDKIDEDTVPASLIQYLKINEGRLGPKEGREYSTIVYRYLDKDPLPCNQELSMRLLFHYYLLRKTNRLFNKAKAGIFISNDPISIFSIKTQENDQFLNINPAIRLKDLLTEIDSNGNIKFMGRTGFCIRTTFPILKFYSVCLHEDKSYNINMLISKHIIILRDDFPFHLSLVNLTLSQKHHRTLILQRHIEILASKLTEFELYSEQIFLDLFEGFVPEHSSDLSPWIDFICHLVWYFDGEPDRSNYGQITLDKYIDSQTSSNPLIQKASVSALSSYYQKIINSLTNYLQDF